MQNLKFQTLLNKNHPNGQVKDSAEMILKETAAVINEVEVDFRHKLEKLHIFLTCVLYNIFTPWMYCILYYKNFAYTVSIAYNGKYADSRGVRRWIPTGWRFYFFSLESMLTATLIRSTIFALLRIKIGNCST